MATKIRFKPTLIEIVIAVLIVVVLGVAMFGYPSHKRHLKPKAEEFFGFWIAIPDIYNYHRLYLTNEGSGFYAVSEYDETNVYRVTSWTVSEWKVSVKLQCVSHPDWGTMQIKGTANGSRKEIHSTVGGTNQTGEHWSREILLLKEEVVKRRAGEVESLMYYGEKK